MRREKPDAAKLQAQHAELARLVDLFTKAFAALENEMAQLLHNVLFYKDSYEESRVAHAIYFSPDGFGQRQAIVNNAVTEWLTEHPLGGFDFLAEWRCINHRLGTLRGIRNLLAHGAVRTLGIRDKWHVRVVPPTYDPKMLDHIASGSLPGISAEELRHTNQVLHVLSACVSHMGYVIAENDYGDSSLRRRFVELGEHRSQLNSLYPADQTPKACRDQPEPSAG